MRRPLLLLSTSLLLAVGGCRSAEHAASTQGAEARPAAAAPAVTAQPREARRFGAPLTPGAEALPLARVLASPDDFGGRDVTLEATVRRNCTRRGCWMELAESMDSSQPGCRVTFKDYGFFVPLDSAGSHAKVQGKVEVKTVSPPEVAHLESEGAKFAGKQPDGSAREIRLVATGVELTRSPG